MQNYRIIICPDSFKGSLSASEAAEAICKGIQSVSPESECVLIPMGDGGEGTIDLISQRFPGEWKEISSYDPLLREIKARLYVFNQGKSVFIESAETCGLNLVEQDRRNPLELSTYGLGLLIKCSIEGGCSDIFIGLGGSATIDGGLGMLLALGWGFEDNESRRLSGKGKDLIKVDRIIEPEKNSYGSLNFYAICDVENPLCGKSGAANVFGPQKGATREQIIILEAGMKNFAEQTHNLMEADMSDNPGAGAAGGLGFALQSFLNAKTVSGADLILDLSKFDSELIGADLVITGEGRIDSQSVNGKIGGAILERCKKEKVPVIAICGEIKDCELLLEEGFLAVFPVGIYEGEYDKRMEQDVAFFNLKETARQIMRLIDSGIH